eukprot:977753-Prorocentrum_minimum.AAC.1
MGDTSKVAPNEMQGLRVPRAVEAETSHHSSESDTPLAPKPYVANRTSKQQFKALMRKNFIMKVL